jgi:pimeloyl-ACP methyl ester carboxylesterase
LSTRSIYKTAAGETEIKAIYDHYLRRLDLPYTERTVDTRFGSTHLLVFGPEDGPALIMLHGGNSVNPHGLLGLRSLLARNRYRVYAPDTIGHPGYSAPYRIPTRGSGYGEWMVDILDTLGLERVPFIGPSFGGGITVRTAAYTPERIEKAVLIVPAGIVRPPMRSMLVDVVWPMLRYRLKPSQESLRRAVLWMGTEPADEDFLRLIQAVFQHLHIEPDMFAPATREDLAGFTAPTMVIAARNDLLFPGEAVIQRAKEIIPNLVETKLLEGRHLPSHEEYEWISERIQHFLEDDRRNID